MQGFGVAKMVIGLVASSGVNAIVHSAIKNNITPASSREAIKIAVGSSVLGMMAGESAWKYTSRSMDEARDFIMAVSTRIQEKQAAREQVVDQ